MTTRFAFFMFAGSGLVIGTVAWLGWLLWKSNSESAIAATVARIELIGLIGASMATLIALIGAYYTFFTPFSPSITVGAYTWRVRPEGSPNAPVEIALWLSAQNRGVTPGEISDLIAVVSFPRGDWLLHPMFFVDSGTYLKAISRPQDSPDLPATEPFTPIFIPGRGQVSRAALFIPFEGKANRQLIEPGVHKVVFFARLQDGTVQRIADRKIVLEADMVQNWRQGTTIGGAQFERDRPTEDVLREFGVELRLQ